MIIPDENILHTYMQGFKDEIWGLDDKEFSDPILIKAYQLGRDHAIIGDDVRSVDYLSNEEILNQIKNGTT